MGNSFSKICRILSQAETWYDQNKHLLATCKIITSGSQSTPPYVELSDITKAVASASSNISLDLDEAKDLEALAVRLERWHDRVSAVAPKRSKRHGKATRTKYTIADLELLLNEAPSFPVDTSDEVKRL